MLHCWCFTFTQLPSQSLTSVRIYPSIGGCQDRRTKVQMKVRGNRMSRSLEVQSKYY